MKDTATAMGWASAPVGERFDRSAPGSKSIRFQMYEYGYYFILFYALMGAAVGISFGSAGIAMHMALALLCIFRVRSGALKVYRPLTSMMLCSAWFVASQVLVHHTAITDFYLRPFMSFVLALIIVKSLLSRPGFVRRASVALFIIGLTTLPFLDLNRTAGRAGLSAGALANANDLAAWFGFCAIAFMVRGLESRRSIGRWACWGITLFSLSIIGLTVGRGALAAFAIAAAVAFRTRLKRGFLPVLGIVALAGVALAYGVFDHAIERYAERGAEDTGRFPVWPIVAKRALEHPVFGVPLSDFGTLSVTGTVVTPHNGLLFIALGGGAVAFLAFLAHWMRCLRGAIKPPTLANPDFVYLLPLLTYSILIVMQLNQAFTSAWCVVIMCACLHNLALHHRVRISAPKSRLMLKGRRREVEQFAIPNAQFSSQAKRLDARSRS